MESLSRVRGRAGNAERQRGVGPADATPPVSSILNFGGELGSTVQRFISLKPTMDALQNLDEALRVKKPSKLERDGIVQRFEIAYEQMWKSAQRVLRENEIHAETPKDVFRELGRIGWIDNVEAWIQFQKSRNETSHEYGEKLAQKSYDLAKAFLPIGQKLLLTLKEKSRE